MKDYKRFKTPTLDMFDVMMGVTLPPQEEIDPETEVIDMSQFKSFLKTEPYTAWNNGLHYSNKRCGTRRKILSEIFPIIFTTYSYNARCTTFPLLIRYLLNQIGHMVYSQN